MFAWPLNSGTLTCQRDGVHAKPKILWKAVTMMNTTADDILHNLTLFQTNKENKNVWYARNPQIANSCISDKFSF